LSCTERRPWAAFVLALFVLGALVPAGAAPKVRIKDIASVLGVRENQLLGVGLVTGLAGKGDSAGSALLQKALSNMVSSFGLEIGADDVKSRNAAVVMVSAEVPPFARPGERIDLSVSSVGDARSLEGGVLLQTNLRAANGQAYAAAQGRISVAVGPGAVQTVGSVKGGAIVEREILSTFTAGNKLSFVLRNPDFVTAAAVAEAIKAGVAGLTVTTRDAALVEVEIPDARKGDLVALIGQIESLTVTPDTRGRVVIDSQTGVVIIGDNVRINRVAVSYKDVEVSVGGGAYGGSGGAGDKPKQFVIPETSSVEDFVKTLKEVGLTTDVVIGILKALDRAGALYGTLIIL
jgi:flagellar P-ring protein FlgI